MKRLTIFLSALLATACSSLNPYDTNSPVGWAKCESISGGTYNLSGGGKKGKAITLKAGDGQMPQAFIQAAEENDIIIFDGADGEFIFSGPAVFRCLHNKTIVGINNAVLKTEFELTEELKAAIRERVPEGLSSGSNTGGYLSTGEYVNEQRELNTRQAIIDITGDNTESCRNAGIVVFSDNCENIIIRNLTFQGPGAIDIGGTHLMRIGEGSNHLWIDHCSFIDAQRTNMCIGVRADCIDVTWCIFDYTDKCYSHAFSNLIGGSDEPDVHDPDKLNTTFAWCIWGHRVEARTPMVRFGNVHVLNCYHDCVKSWGVNPRMDSELLVEKCYFDENVRPLWITEDRPASKAYTFKDNYIAIGKYPEDKGAVTMPYTVAKTMEAKDVKAQLLSPTGAGPNLKHPLKINF